MLQTNDEKQAILRALNPGDVLNTTGQNGGAQWVAVFTSRSLVIEEYIYNFSLTVTMCGGNPYTIAIATMLSEDYLIKSRYIAVAAMDPASIPASAVTV
jgi:hypothetical protein